MITGDLLNGAVADLVNIDQATDDGTVPTPEQDPLDVAERACQVSEPLPLYHLRRRHVGEFTTPLVVGRWFPHMREEFGARVAREVPEDVPAGRRYHPP